MTAKSSITPNRAEAALLEYSRSLPPDERVTVRRATEATGLNYTAAFGAMNRLRSFGLWPHPSGPVPLGEEPCDRCATMGGAVDRRGSGISCRIDARKYGGEARCCRSCYNHHYKMAKRDPSRVPTAPETPLEPAPAEPCCVCGTLVGWAPRPSAPPKRIRVDHLGGPPGVACVTCYDRCRDQARADKAVRRASAIPEMRTIEELVRRRRRGAKVAEIAFARKVTLWEARRIYRAIHEPPPPPRPIRRVVARLRRAWRRGELVRVVFPELGHYGAREW